MPRTAAFSSPTPSTRCARSTSGALVDETRHLARLERSLGELKIGLPMTRRALGLVMRETVRRNRVKDGLLYLQVTRGAAPRDFAFPRPDVEPTLVCLARSLNVAKRDARAEAGIAVITLPDIRWGRSDIKTVMLLPACLAKEAARAAGADEAWLVDRDGFVTEGASSNAWIVDAEGQPRDASDEHGDPRRRDARHRHRCSAVLKASPLSSVLFASPRRSKRAKHLLRPRPEP